MLSTKYKHFFVVVIYYLKFFLYIKNDAGNPMINGVGAKSNCSALPMHVGSNGIMGNMYSNG